MHEAGYSTWVSMEPYPTPNIYNQEIEDVLEAVSFVDKDIFGRTNYNKVASPILVARTGTTALPRRSHVTAKKMASIT